MRKNIQILTQETIITLFDVTVIFDRRNNVTVLSFGLDVENCFTAVSLVDTKVEWKEACDPAVNLWLKPFQICQQQNRRAVIFVTFHGPELLSRFLELIENFCLHIVYFMTKNAHLQRKISNQNRRRKFLERSRTRHCKTSSRSILLQFGLNKKWDEKKQKKNNGILSIPT